MSHLVIRESSDMAESSSDAELNGVQGDNDPGMINLKRMMKSKDEVDKRFMTVFKIKKAHRMGERVFDQTMNTNVIPEIKETKLPAPDSTRINLLPSLF